MAHPELEVRRVDDAVDAQPGDIAYSQETGSPLGCTTDRHPVSTILSKNQVDPRATAEAPGDIRSTEVPHDPRPLSTKDEPHLARLGGPDHQRAVMLGLLKTVCAPRVDVRSERATPHHRELVLFWGDTGRLAVRLDYGLGFFHVKRERGTSTAFPFDATVNAQLAHIRDAHFSLVNETTDGPRIYVGALTAR